MSDPPQGEREVSVRDSAGFQVGDNNTQVNYISHVTPAKKLMLAAIGTGIAGVITTVVIAIPHTSATSPHLPGPLTILGGVSPGLQPSAATGGPLQSIAPGTDPCGLDGVYVVRGNVEVGGTVTTTNVAALVTKAAFANETTGSYLLQASPGQTAVLTGMHTVLLRRLPASTVPATVVVVDSRCGGVSLPIKYDASINLDAANLTPKLTQPDGLTGTRTPVTDLATVVAQGQPLALNFDATTTKFDVTWQLRFDYAVDGRAQSATMPSAGPPFQTDAIAPGDSWLTLTLNSDGSTWSASAATAEQKRAKDQADVESAVAYDYNSLSRDLSAALRDERHVLDEAGEAGNSTVCADASTVAVDANMVAADAQEWVYDVLNYPVGDLTIVRSAASSLREHLRALLQAEPGFNGNAGNPSPAQGRQAVSAALAAGTKAASRVNAMINKVNADVAAAYAYAAKAAAAGQQCKVPGPTPSPIAPVN